MAVSAHAQSYQDLLLPQSRHISGTVVDEDGKPVAGVRLDHLDDQRHEYRTDENGWFELDTRAPAFVLRQDGFRSQLLKTQSTVESRVVLHQASGRSSFPPCSVTGRYVGHDVGGSRFRFLEMRDVKAGPWASDIDYVTRKYLARAKSKNRAIQHSSGPLWGLGLPSVLDIWRSNSIDERAFRFGRTLITDSKGTLDNGNRWRSLGMFGESASYSDVTEATAQILDRFMDEACLMANPSIIP